MMRFQLYKKTDLGKGYSLIEVLVAIAIFSIVMIVAVGALVSIIDLNRKARTQKQALNNLNSAIESMTRTIRDGVEYHCASDSTPADYGNNFTDPLPAQPCPLGANVFVFNAGVTRTAYFVSGGQVFRFKSGGGGPIAMTAPDVVVEDLTFRTIEYNSVIEQPNVRITISGRAGASDPATETLFTLQTTVSQRLYPDASPTGGTPAPTANPHCPFTAVSGRYIVNFEAEKADWSFLICCASPPLSVLYPLDNFDADLTNDEILTGVYDVYFATWDDHCLTGDPNCGCGSSPPPSENSCPAKPNRMQPLEHMKLILRQGGSPMVDPFVGGDAVPNLAFTNGVSLDVPWNVNDITTYLGRVTISGGNVDSIIVEHATRNSDRTTYNGLWGIDTKKTQSAVAACVAFDDTSSGVTPTIREF
jgi:prepilin-type N-terminal cleavage/methylation domain-containing protein